MIPSDIYTFQVIKKREHYELLIPGDNLGFGLSKDLKNIIRVFPTIIRDELFKSFEHSYKPFWVKRGIGKLRPMVPFDLFCKSLLGCYDG